MSDMSTEGQHAAPARSRDTAIIAAWAVLVIAAVTSGTYNMVHAFEHSQGTPALPFLYGAVPPVLAALLAHVAAAYRSSRWIKAAVIAVTVASMSLSITSVASVAAPMGGRTMSVIFGLAVDAAAMTALVLILDNHRRRGIAESEVEQARAAVTDAETRARGAERQAREAVTAATARADEAAAAAASAQESLDATTAELATVRAELQGLKSGMNKRRGSGRKATRSSGPRKPGGSAPNAAPGSGPESDVDTQAAALSILDTEPGISGGELGRRLGVSESYGCRLKRELARTGAGPEADEQS